MPRQDKSKPIHILVDENEREQINAFAEEMGYKITADYIRHLIKTDMAAHGRKIDLKVNRGGDRRSAE